MNETLIMQMVEPYVSKGQLTYSAFDEIFDILSRHEQYQVVEILANNGIEMVDQEDSSDEIDKIIDLSEEDDPLREHEDFQGIDKDEVAQGEYVEKKEELRIYRNIKQSNEVLCYLIQEGNQQARQDLCVKNERLVKKYAAKYEHRYGNSLDMEDLKQAGFLGLLRAAETYDDQLGYEFSTYAVYWIKQAITRELMNDGFLIRVPVHMLEKVIKVTRMENTLREQGISGHEVNERIAEELECPIKIVEECMKIRRNYMSVKSLNLMVGEEQDSELGEFIADEEAPQPEELALQRELTRRLKMMVGTLTERESDIIQLRFGLLDGNPQTLEEVGLKYNVTRERIRQIQGKALRKLRHPTRTKLIKEFDMSDI